MRVPVKLPDVCSVNGLTVVAQDPGNLTDRLPCVPTANDFPNVHGADLVISHVSSSLLVRITGRQDGSGSEICNQAGETFWPQGGGNIMALVGESFWPCRGKHYGPGGGIILALHGGNIMALDTLKLLSCVP